MNTLTPVHHFNRGDYATTDSKGGSTPERVRVVRAEWITVGTVANGTYRRERWLHVEALTDGARWVTHPSRLIPLDASW